MSLLVLGLNHRTAPLDLREQLTIDKEKLAPALNSLSAYVEQGIIVSTCNRLEIYSYDGQDENQTARLLEFLAETSGVLPSKLDSHLYQMGDEDCARHLFQVASGLDSMVVGERQVLGQVRNAFSTATQQGHARGPLSRLFHQAFRTGRRVHRETGLSKHARSVSKAAVQLARNSLQSLNEKQVLVIGAGDAGRLVARSLSEAGTQRITVVNRTEWRAQELAQDLGGVAAPFEDLPQQLAQADVVISSSGSPGYLLDLETVKEATRFRSDRPLVVVDIAVPRDVEPTVGSLEGVQLYDIDSLQLVAETDADSLGESVALAQQIVEEETLRFRHWWEQIHEEPLVANFRQRAEAIRSQELAKTWRYLENGNLLPADAENQEKMLARLEAMTSAIIKKVLHHPTVHLKEEKDPSRQEFFRRIFDLDDQPSSPADPEEDNPAQESERDD